VANFPRCAIEVGHHHQPFDRDYWGLINIFRAADRRLGQRQLRAFAEQLNPTEPAVKVIHRRFTLILGG